MLRHLSISNYALIDSLELDLSRGLSIITGETGAGKSILLGALGLILGQRADTQSLKDQSRKCIIEGTFELGSFHVKAFFEQHDLDYEPTTFVRREITPQGKSRAFINDTPVKLSQLRDLGEKLVDIHSQHETLTLQASGFQLGLVDAFAEHDALHKQYQQQYAQFKSLEKQLEQLLDQEKQATTDSDYYQFLFNELEAANAKAGEEETLQHELDTLSHAETIKGALHHASEGLNGPDSDLVAQLNEIRLAVSKVSKYNPAIATLEERLKSTYIELEDIASEIEAVSGSIEHDAERIQVLTDRLDALNHLLSKHRVNTAEELLAIQEDINQKLNNISSLDAAIARTREELEAARTAAMKLAVQLSENRAGVKDTISQSVRKLLTQLGMPDAQLTVEQTISDELGPEGMDTIQFLFTANKGTLPKALHKVASGGELSRLMLSIKSLLAGLTALPTIIFDEIDTGVSGEIADKVGNIMRQMAGEHQVIAISHLPQIASKGNRHYLVYKKTTGEVTNSAIRELVGDDRINEVAKMLSGEQLSEAAIVNARELLRA